MKSDDEILLEIYALAVKTQSKKIIINAVTRWLLMVVYIMAIGTSITVCYHTSNIHGISLYTSIVTMSSLSILFSIAHLLNLQLFKLYRSFDVFDVLIEIEQRQIEKIDETNNIHEKY